MTLNIGTEVEPGEIVLRKSAANVRRGWESRGGVLFLTSRRLLFQPHPINLSRTPMEIMVDEIQMISECRTRFLGLIPLADNALRLDLPADRSIEICLRNRDAWKEAISETLDQLKR